MRRLGSEPRVDKALWLLACATPVVTGILMLLLVRGAGRYSPPDFGGPEPKATHEAALEILERGRTEMVFHPTGYAYLVAPVYLVLPRVPSSVLWVQILLLPSMVWSVARLAGLAGDGARRAALILMALYYPLGYYAASFSSVYPAMIFLSLALAWFLPSDGRDHVAIRAMASGAALGIATCLRPNLGLVGLVLVLASWITTRDLRRTAWRILPVAAVSLGLVVVMTWANPPEPGQLTRGSQAFHRSVLQGSYQFADKWWDWDWYESDGDPGFVAYREHIARIEAETGRPFTAPESQPVVAREAWRRISDHPWLALKKAAISAVRIWILIPTHLSSLPIKVIIALQEFVLLASAVGGALVLRRRPAGLALLAGTMVLVAASHLVLHVEPRYSLPARGAELALAAIGLERLWATSFGGLLTKRSSTGPGGSG